MSDFLFAYYDNDRDAVIVRLDSGTEIAVLDTDEAESLGDEILAASRRESTNYEEFLDQEDRPEDEDETLPDQDSNAPTISGQGPGSRQSDG